MFEIFRKYISEKALLTDEEFKAIEAVSRDKKLRRRQYLLQEGDIWKLNAFVCKGLLRSYTVDSKATEHIMQFAPENHWTGDRESLMTGNPSRYNIDAIEDSELILIGKQDFDRLCKSIPALNDVVNTVLQKSFIVSQERIHANITYSAEEKYQNFLHRFPNIINRVPQHMIASYLGISAETLSRVRKNAVQKQNR